MREATNRPKVTLKELENPTVHSGVSLQKSGQKKSHCLRKETPQTYGKWSSDQKKRTFLAFRENGTKYLEIPQENPFQSLTDFVVVQKLTGTEVLPLDDDLLHTAKATLEWFKG